MRRTQILVNAKKEIKKKRSRSKKERERNETKIPRQLHLPAFNSAIVCSCMAIFSLAFFSSLWSAIASVLRETPRFREVNIALYLSASAASFLSLPSNISRRESSLCSISSVFSLSMHVRTRSSAMETSREEEERRERYFCFQLSISS